MTTSVQIPESDPDYVPPGGDERAVAVAHSVQSVLGNIAHAMRHAGAAAASPRHRKFNLRHAHDHLSLALSEQDSNIANLVQFDPEAGEELKRLRGTRSSWEYAPDGPARHRTPIHLADSVRFHLIHAHEHAGRALEATDPESEAFEVGHLSHIQEAYSHHRKYEGALTEFSPAVAAELAALGELADLGTPSRTAATGPERSMNGRLLLDLRCPDCGGPRTPGGLCTEGCGRSADAGQRTRDRAFAELTAEMRGDAGSRWTDPI
jgi:hypothetical protein